jgi:hypothetical protein
VQDWLNSTFPESEKEAAFLAFSAITTAWIVKTEKILGYVASSATGIDSKLLTSTAVAFDRLSASLTAVLATLDEIKDADAPNREQAWIVARATIRTVVASLTLDLESDSKRLP